MATKFSQPGNEPNIRTIAPDIKESKTLDAQKIAQLIAQDVKEILAEKQRQVRQERQ